MQVVVNFNVLVNVIPKGAEAEPVVESVRPLVRDGVEGIEVRLGNSGTRYYTAASATWEIRGRAADGTEISLRRTPAEMAELIGVGVVAPGKTRIFFVPTKTPLDEGSIQVRLDP